MLHALQKYPILIQKWPDVSLGKFARLARRIPPVLKITLVCPFKIRIISSIIELQRIYLKLLAAVKLKSDLVII